MDDAAIDAGDFGSITETAREFTREIDDARAARGQ